ncbi:MAG: site-specific DNA-methyltransferase [Candidatus Latescibacteria bacterium]|nr:site-specific DNA-methyltransferase [Candidatus Latescibacterota bacterium]
MQNGRCKIETSDYVRFLSNLEDQSVDLILTDPPYTISRKTGFKHVGPKSVERFAVDMDFGTWDHAAIDLDILAEQALRVLRRSGTAIIFYDLWKMSYLADSMSNAGFKQLRFIEWVKKNPVPLNSKRNYLTNSREIAVSGVKLGKPTFHSEYDNGIYSYPIPNNGKRHHPTQKPMSLFEELIEKHSNHGDMVVDPFLGSGTTAIAALSLSRCFSGCDIDENYVEIAKERVHEVHQSRFVC